MKAIPTTYHATTFRSRLEANWAATLDAYNIPWHYEPEGYELSDGTWYLPDFYLPTARAWLEVKGPHDERMDKLEKFAADLWAESGATTTYESNAPMVLLGRPPEAPTFYERTVIGLPTFPRVLGVMGPGKAYSVALTTCSTCRSGTVVALWQPLCRNCGTDYAENALEVWLDGKDPYQSFVEVPRP